MTATSTRARSMRSAAAKVPNSKKVSVTSPRAASTRSNASTSAASDTARPPILTRSL